MSLSYKQKTTPHKTIKLNQNTLKYQFSLIFLIKMFTSLTIEYNIWIPISYFALPGFHHFPLILEQNYATFSLKMTCLFAFAHIVFPSENTLTHHLVLLISYLYIIVPIKWHLFKRPTANFLKYIWLLCLCKLVFFKN